MIKWWVKQLHYPTNTQIHALFIEEMQYKDLTSDSYTYQQDNIYIILKLNSDLKQDSQNDSNRSKGNQIYHVAIPSSRKTRIL
jgi:hypothetical protein